MCLMCVVLLMYTIYNHTTSKEPMCTNVKTHVILSYEKQCHLKDWGMTHDIGENSQKVENQIELTLTFTFC